MTEPRKAVSISIGTPGEEVWDYMESDVLTQYT